MSRCFLEVFPKASFSIGKVRCLEGRTQPKALCPYLSLHQREKQPNKINLPAPKLAFRNTFPSYYCDSTGVTGFLLLCFVLLVSSPSTSSTQHFCPFPLDLVDCGILNFLGLLPIPEDTFGNHLTSLKETKDKELRVRAMDTKCT